MRKLHSISLLALIFAGFALSGAFAGGPPAGSFWADGMMYRTVATPNNLPNKGPKDGIYVFDELEGQHPVAESKPGDQDYNGGRWQVYVVAFTEDGVAAHDPDGDGVVNFQLTSWEAVQNHIGLGHLEMVGIGPSFVCPLIKK